MYHTLVNPSPGFPIYELYVILENGRLKVIHEFGQEQKSLYLGQGLNHDKFHDISISIDPKFGKLEAQLDKSHEMNITLKSLENHYEIFKKQKLSFVMYFGGTNQKEPINHQQFSGIPRFIGCLGKIKFFNDYSLSNESKIEKNMEHVMIKTYDDIELNCKDRCKIMNLCSMNSVCINHYTHTSCDCFGTKLEDWHCRSENLTTITLSGYSFVSYKIYNYKDRVHSNMNRISLQFKTGIREAILLYANGEHPKHNYIAITLYDGKLNFEINLGSGQVEASFDDILSDNKWHNLTIKHYYDKIKIIIDEKNIKHLELPGNHYHLHVDPDVFFGGVSASRLSEKFSKKIKIPFDISWKYVGCLKSIYFNEINVLYELNMGNKAAKYHSLFPPKFQCSNVDPLPITFSTESSYFIIKISSHTIKISMEFKTHQTDVVVASGNIKKFKGKDQHWILHFRNGIASFTIYESSKQTFQIINNVIHLTEFWQHLSIEINNEGSVIITSNYKHSQRSKINHFVDSYFENVYFGSNVNDTHKLNGFRGCLRDIIINDNSIDPRLIVSNKSLRYGKITLDDCQLVNPCNKPDACEHGGKCIPQWETGEIKCNCEGTGYMGKRCHFCKF